MDYLYTYTHMYFKQQTPLIIKGKWNASGLEGILLQVTGSKGQVKDNKLEVYWEACLRCLLGKVCFPHVIKALGYLIFKGVIGHVAEGTDLNLPKQTGKVLGWFLSAWVNWSIYIKRTLLSSCLNFSSIKHHSFLWNHQNNNNDKLIIFSIYFW